MRKIETEITGRKNNGGMHNLKLYKDAVAILSTQTFKSPRLYHLVLTDWDISEFAKANNAERFQKALKAICRKLKDSGIDYHWRACLERDDEKGLHFHIFLLVESAYKRPGAVLRLSPDGWLKSMLRDQNLRVHLAQPKNDMHRVGGIFEGKRQNYASLAGEKLDDCINWISYLYKARSKPNDIRNLYFSSRNSIVKGGKNDD